MREIKFRAWDKTNNIMRDVLCVQWHYEEKTMKKLMSFVEYFDFDCKVGPQTKKFIRMYPSYLVGTENPENKYCGEPTFELIQFTDLHNKNGKEIWEGDILLTPGKFKLVVRIDNIGYGDPKFFNIGFDVCEVIGNIWENGDLLNGK